MVVNGLGLPGDTSSQARTYWHILPSLWMRRPTSQSHSTASLTGNVKPCTRRDRLGGGGAVPTYSLALLMRPSFRLLNVTLRLRSLSMRQISIFRRPIMRRHRAASSWSSSGPPRRRRHTPTTYNPTPSESRASKNTTAPRGAPTLAPLALSVSARAPARAI